MPRRKHSQKRITYLTEWERANIKQIKLAFNKDKDFDILEKLKEVPNNTDYVRKLIRADIKANRLITKVDTNIDDNNAKN